MVKHVRGAHDRAALQEEILENEEDDWAHDPANPRNWKSSRKWTMTAIVRLLSTACMQAC